ncbi:DNA polymerase delta, subunit 4-domain-containing protein [Gautieria morchelliformis]|nr:DNA polymerase delta, subunit 4-domain-containing protein [Gautieria morchelliformis]
MAPKRSTVSGPKKPQTSLKQATLTFKHTKRGAAALSKAKAKSITRAKVENDSENVMIENSGSENEEASSVIKEPLDMQDRAGAYNKYYREVKEKMGNVPPIHTEGQMKIHHMLRVFDNTYDYGPCVGMTRLERWERAEALGLNPPAEVRSILLTEQGSSIENLVHPVFYGQVL